MDCFVTLYNIQKQKVCVKVHEFEDRRTSTSQSYMQKIGFDRKLGLKRKKDQAKMTHGLDTGKCSIEYH